MPSNKKKGKRSKVGLPPGSVVYTGKGRTHKTSIQLIDYQGDELNEVFLNDLKDAKKYTTTNSVTWINIDGIHDESMVEQAGSVFGLHRLILEDIANTQQRPKMEYMDDYIAFSLKMISYDEEQNTIDSEHVSFVLNKNYVISFQEKPGDVFEPVRERIRNPKGKIREKGNDYLVYALIDVVVDNYFVVLEGIGENLLEMEDAIFEQPDKSALQAIQTNKRQLIKLRKAIYPLREAINALQREDTGLIADDTIKYFNDVYDHTIQVNETIENYRDINSSLKDVYISGISLKMNQVMQVLTIISTIFIPLTFLAGIYGMNMYIPEVAYHHFYYVLWGIMIFIALGLVIYFKRKKWL